MKPTVPFKMDNPAWFTETEGILSADETSLRLEFRNSDNLIGVIKSDVRQVSLPMETIAEITYQKRFLEDAAIIIRVNQMRDAAALPGFQQGEIKLEIARKHRPAAEQFVAAIQPTLPARKV